MVQLSTGYVLEQVWAPKNPYVFPERQAESQQSPRETFTCRASGNFQDASSSKQYWHCDLDNQGGFVAIRRTCPADSVFDSSYGHCVRFTGPKANQPYGYNQNFESQFTKSEHQPEIFTVFPPISSQNHLPRLAEKKCSKTTTSFLTIESYNKETTTLPSDDPSKGCLPKNDDICSESGAYANPEDHSSFYLCFPSKENNKMESIKVKCPRGMMFDRNVRKCTSVFDKIPQTRTTADDGFELLLPDSDSDVRVYQKTEDEKKGLFNGKEKRHALGPVKGFSCPSPGRYADPTNCENYYLCYQEEGGAVSYLPMRCPRNTLFDIQQKTCAPRGLVKCVHSNINTQ